MQSSRACLALLLAVALTPAAAQDDSEKTFYDVEIVLFENLDVRSAESERWQPQVVVPAFAGAAAFEPGALRSEGMVELPEGFRPLPAEQARLNDAVERLEDSARYRMIRHLHWRQPALEADAAVPLRFHAGEPLALRVPADAYTEVDLGPPAKPEADADAELAAEAEATTAPDEADTQAAETLTVAETAAAAPAGADALAPPAPEPRMREVRVYPLDGTIRLVVSRYLHVYADLYYTTAVDWSEAAAGTGDTAGKGRRDGEPRDASVPPALVARGPEGREMLSYPFVQQRRMRSGVLHYLDHPVLGMLVLVTPRAEDDGAGDDGAGDG